MLASPATMQFHFIDSSAAVAVDFWMLASAIRRR
jgi:hypothetical protein